MGAHRRRDNYRRSGNAHNLGSKEEAIGNSLLELKALKV
jgi:hypothetical protein